jgi:Holliday junction resolvase RusA-like endonuclease
MDLDFKVYGIPQPKGSTKGFAYQAKDKSTGQPRIGKHGRPVYLVATTAANPKTKGWEAVVETAALVARQRAGFTDWTPSPMTVFVEFVLPRTKALKMSQPEHGQKPDLDKLVRGVLDALTGVVWKDDKQVVTVTAKKRYARPEESPHAHVVVHRVEEDPESVARRPARRDVPVRTLARNVPF